MFYAYMFETVLFVSVKFGKSLSSFTKTIKYIYIAHMMYSERRFLFVIALLNVEQLRRLKQN